MLQRLAFVIAIMSLAATGAYAAVFERLARLGAGQQSTGSGKHPVSSRRSRQGCVWRGKSCLQQRCRRQRRPWPNGRGAPNPSRGSGPGHKPGRQPRGGFLLFRRGYGLYRSRCCRCWQHRLGNRAFLQRRRQVWFVTVQFPFVTRRFRFVIVRLRFTRAVVRSGKLLAAFAARLERCGGLLAAFVAEGASGNVGGRSRAGPLVERFVDFCAAAERLG